MTEETINEEVCDHQEICERIKIILLLQHPNVLLEICKMLDEDNDIEVKYLGDSLYSWKQIF